MHVWFLETNGLLLQHVVETKINAIITQKKWLNKALTTHKPGLTETILNQLNNQLINQF